MRRILVAIALLAGCTKNNPGFGGPSLDLSAEVDLGGVDLAVPTDLPLGGDLSTAGGDLAGVDLATVQDLARTDLLVRCNGVACPGCCVNGQCRSLGDSCATAAEVCTAGGCQACGGASQPCCALLLCAQGFICNTGTCLSCGGPGQACCPGNQCAGGGCCAASGVGSTAVCVPSGKRCGNAQVCLDGACVGCGTGGQPCCENYGCLSGCCVPSTRTCGAAITNCTFALCGGVAGACCDSGVVNRPGVCSASGTACTQSNNGDACLVCGGDNQPCCGANTCTNGCCVDGTCRASGTSCGTAGGNCAGTSCGGGTCGGPGQGCCGGTRCTAPDTRCISGVCNVCGGRDQRCCVDPASQTNIFCEPPFVPSPEAAGDAGQICFCRAP